MIFKNVAIIGGGIIGTYNCEILLKNQFKVSVYDISEEACLKLNTKFSDIDNFIASTNPNDILKTIDAVIICVPTPIREDKTPNSDPLNSVALTLQKFLKQNLLITIESTIWPGYSEKDFLEILLDNSKLEVEKDFFLIHSPERVNPGDTMNFAEIARVVGGYGPNSLSIGIQFYSIFINEVIPVKSLKVAELTKLLENSFRDINIAFINEFASYCNDFKISVFDVIDAASSKPYSFLPHYPGSGVGGECIPVDPNFLIWSAKDNDIGHITLAERARWINDNRPKQIVDYTIRLTNLFFKNHENLKFFIFGISYKPRIKDLRNAPSLTIIKELNDHMIIPFLIDIDENDFSSVDPNLKYKITQINTENSFNDNNTNNIVIIVNGDNRINSYISNFENFKSENSLIIDPHRCVKNELIEKLHLPYWSYGILRNLEIDDLPKFSDFNTKEITHDN
ncbi:MAG: UDP-N-acetyl-D-glucosamine 6-dehydrogenase [Candidatus Heimdallarchaeota archaeon LC_2]|nr:MAG: UDP-N-acetyl-D-glucosamine 6-dehydrogenase [Candidatus Heimdallarchaeota archaeon LC_2]